jgi:hypothetical protein
MKKLILVVLAVFLMSGIAAAATTVDIKGQIRVYQEFNNIGRSSGLLPYYLLPAYKGTGNQQGAATDNVFTDQRTRLYFNVKSDENVGAYVALEIDSYWGQSAFEVARNGTGGGQGTDAVNIEVKNANFWFKPMAALKITAGTMTFVDDMAGVFIGGGDMAGFRVDYSLSKTASLATGLYTWWQNQLTTSATSSNGAWRDSVYFIPITVKQQLGSGTGSLFFYTIVDKTKAKDSSFPVTGARPLPNNYQDAQIYYAGLNYAGKAGNVSYSLMGAYNFGTFKDYETTATSKTDVDISAFAVNARVDVKIGAGKLRLAGLYISGEDSSDVDKYRGFVTGDQYAAHQTMPMLQDDLILLINTTDVISNATFLATTPNNNGDGLGVAYLAYDHDVTPKINLKGVLGFATAAEQSDKTSKFQTGAAPATYADRKGKDMGIEYNVQMKYKFSENLLISGVASKVSLGDYFKTASIDSDDPYRVLVKFIYSF